MSDRSTEYFVAGAPRSNHSGQVIVYTVSGQKQLSVIDSERGKQVLRTGCLKFPSSWCTDNMCVKFVCCSARSALTSARCCAPWMSTTTVWRTSCWLAPPCLWAGRRRKRAESTSSQSPRWGSVAGRQTDTKSKKKQKNSAWLKARMFYLETMKKKQWHQVVALQFFSRCTCIEFVSVLWWPGHQNLGCVFNQPAGFLPQWLEIKFFSAFLP